MPSVGPMSAGFKQVPAGGYMTVISTLAETNMYAAPVKSGSGGAATVAAPGALAAGVYAAVGKSAGNSLKDMGSENFDLSALPFAHFCLHLACSENALQMLSF